MSGSNIFMQMILGPVPLPVVGEGLLQGWQGSMELKEFDWSAKFQVKDEKKSGSGGLGLSLDRDPTGFQMNELNFSKRFDVGSAQLHMACDLDLPVVSASITVLHIKHGGRAIHQPGFVLLATDGKVVEIDLQASESDKGAELTEKVKLRFRDITITYLQTVGKDQMPTAPFFYSKALPL